MTTLCLIRSLFQDLNFPPKPKEKHTKSLQLPPLLIELLNVYTYNVKKMVKYSTIKSKVKILIEVKSWEESKTNQNDPKEHKF